MTSGQHGRSGEPSLAPEPDIEFPLVDVRLIRDHAGTGQTYYELAAVIAESLYQPAAGVGNMIRMLLDRLFGSRRTG